MRFVPIGTTPFDHVQSSQKTPEHDHQRGKLYFYSPLGLDYAHLEHVEKAREYLEAALVVARKIKDPRVEAFALEVLENLE